jgi:hypothetical protein
MSPPSYAQKRRLAFLVNFVTSATELLPFSKDYSGNAEWRKPVLADDATFPPAITAVVKQQTAGHCEELAVLTLLYLLTLLTQLALLTLLTLLILLTLL